MSALPDNIEILVRPRTEAQPDGHLRYLVPSNHTRDKYVVELDAYDGNGMCSCRHFTCRCEPLLRRGVHPVEAVERGMIKLKEGRRANDALRCIHLMDARSQFVDDVISAIRIQENKRRARRAG